LDTTGSCSFLLGTKVSHIDRKDGLVQVTTTTHGEAPVVREFDNIIIAFPQTMKALNPIMKLSPAEKSVFECVQTINYHTVALRDVAEAKQKFPHGAQCAIMDDGEFIDDILDGKPSLVYTREDTPISVVYALSNDEKYTTESFEKEMINLLIRKLGYKFEEVPRCSKNWNNYFPHFAAEQFVEKNNELYALQGQWNTYYTGGLCCFENVERSVQYSRFIVEKYF